MIEWSKTDKNFRLGEFRDRYGRECSIQESSIATEECIWLGRDGVGGEDHGARMHLSRALAGELADILRKFSNTGELG